MAADVAIIGCGRVGQKRAAALPPGRLRWACDLRPQLASATASAGGARAAIDYKEAIADSAVRIVVVATINAGLAPISTEAAAAGKHVLVEKPGAISVSEIHSLQTAARASGTKVRVGYNHRFHPGILKARGLVDAGAVGPLLFLRGRYGHGGRIGYDREWRADPKLSGGGELIDQGVHLVDLAGWFLGDFPIVEGHTATYFWDMPVDDNAFLSLRTAAGQTAWLHASCTEWKNLFSLEIYGRDGKIQVDGLGGSYGVERCTHYRMLPQMGSPETSEWEYSGPDVSWAREFAEFEDDIRHDRAPAPGTPEALRTLEIVERIYAAGGPRPKQENANR